MARSRADRYPDLPDFIFAEVRVRGLKAKRVLITGGARGIGGATAARFFHAGCGGGVLDGGRDRADEVDGAGTGAESEGVRGGSGIRIDADAARRVHG